MICMVVVGVDVGLEHLQIEMSFQVRLLNQEVHVRPVILWSSLWVCDEKKSRCIEQRMKASRSCILTSHMGNAGSKDRSWGRTGSSARISLRTNSTALDYSITTTFRPCKQNGKDAQDQEER